MHRDIASKSPLAGTLVVKSSAETLLGLMLIQPSTSDDIARVFHSKSCDGFQSLPDCHCGNSLNENKW